MVKIKVPATTANLGPGLDCMGIALDLYNYIELEEVGDGLKINVEGIDNEAIETDENNLVFKAVNKVFEKNNYKYKGLYLHQYNNIPIARGLGSSAACIVGGMLAANKLCGNFLSFDELMGLAVEMEGHPDNIVPAMVGGCVISVHNNSRVQYIKLDMPKELNFIISVPDFNLKTSEARKILPSSVPLKDAVYNISRAALLSAAIAKADEHLYNLFGEDMLHQPYRSSLIPGMNNVIENARKAGAQGAFLSGAGPSIIAVTNKGTKLIANQMEKTFLDHGISSKVIVSKASECGAEILGCGGSSL